jgi:putative membrane protein
MKLNKAIIIVISILVPIVVASLLFFVSAKSNVGSWVHYLPKLNVTINSLTAILLIIALIMIKQGNESAHRNLMLTALVLGAIFLISYITYHASVPSTVFGDVNHDRTVSESEMAAIGNWRLVYLVLLLSHILMAIIGLPLVLTAVYHGIKDNRSAHKKIVKFTYPVWMFIAVSGIMVYFLISPYY